MTTAICIHHATCELNCHHKAAHDHSQHCITDTWGICHGECLTPDWVATDDEEEL